MADGYAETIDLESMIGAGALTGLRLTMFGNGYHPVPVTSPRMKVKSPGKRPVMENWQGVCASADEKEIRRWTHEQPDCTNTGLLCGELIGVDIDVLDPDLAEEITKKATAMLGATPLVRVGKAPKTLLCYRTETPFRKMTTSSLILPGGIEAKVEILAEGQQFVSHGTHPDTQRPYSWPCQTPETVRLDELPSVTADHFKTFVAAAETIIRAAGGRTKEEIAGKTAKPHPTGAKRINFSKPADSGDFFKQVNRAALDAIEAWFPEIFPDAKFQPGTGAWRVSSEIIGRPLEEDISVHPVNGGRDFGTEKSVSPIDIVIEHGGAADPSEAADWLCRRLGIDPASLGWKKAFKDGKANGSSHGQTPNSEVPTDGLLLSLDDWLSAEIAPPDFVMGEVFHTESRAYLVGPTGLGKTNLSMALAAAMAAGTDFLHWKVPESARKCRKVLYIDGEMGKRLMLQRIQDVVRRHGSKPAGLSVLCRANAGDMPPLNTKEGQQFIEGVIERLGGVDFIVFDNLQALVTGSLREEDAFADVLSWAKTLTSRSIGQIWVHHTGIDETRGYGDKSKEWQFDTVLLLKRVGEGGEVLFDLEFTKARERTPDNRADFAPMRVELDGDVWTVEGTQKTPKTKAPSPMAQAFHGALTDALCVSQETGVTTKEAWRAECRRKGLMHLDPDKDHTQYTKSSKSMFNQYVTELVTARWVGVNGDQVRNTRK